MPFSIWAQRSLTVLCYVAAAILCLACRPAAAGRAAGLLNFPQQTDAAHLHAGAIYRMIAPAVVFIDTPTGTGSGLLLDNGYIVTNAHVVWPYDEARVVFSNGDEFPATPLANVDEIVDLAVLGPLDVETPSLPLADGEDLPIGDEVYLIGYPGETEMYPQPAIAAGLISRVRQWQKQGITYLQTDTAIAGGQSGGALVSATGQVIGLSGFTFADGAFGLSASTADLAPRIKRLAAGDDTDNLTPRHLLTRGTRLRHTFTPMHAYDQRMYIILETPGSEVEVRARSSDDVFLVVTNVYGDMAAHADDKESGSEEGSFVVDVDGPHFLIVGPAGLSPAEKVTVSASHRLYPFSDPDDEKRIALGETTTGQIDYAGDMDVFVVKLTALHPVTIIVESVKIDPYLSVTPISPADRADADAPFWIDDNSGGGLFGLDAQVNFTPTATGDYRIIIEDSFQFDVGGYSLTIEE